MLLGCRKSSLQPDVLYNVLYMEDKMLYSGLTRLRIERAERDKDTSEQQLNKNERRFKQEQVPVSVSSAQ